jgi:hypothetical protein
MIRKARHDMFVSLSGLDGKGGVPIRQHKGTALTDLSHFEKTAIVNGRTAAQVVQVQLVKQVAALVASVDIKRRIGCAGECSPSGRSRSLHLSHTGSAPLRDSEIGRRAEYAEPRGNLDQALLARLRYLTGHMACKLPRKRAGALWRPGAAIFRILGTTKCRRGLGNQQCIVR